MIEITTVKVTSIDIDINQESNEITIKGNYNLISSKGKVVAKQTFNSYDSIKINFDKSIGKNIVSDIESAIELEIGIQEAVKKIRKEG